MFKKNLTGILSRFTIKSKTPETEAAEKQQIQYDCECGSCGGTGIYVGFAEKDGAGVICGTCEGKGERHIEITYTLFNGLKVRPNVTKVYRINPGIGIGAAGGYNLSDFGGMSYEDWLQGQSFPPKSEMRKFTCPAWYYQSADYELKPDWRACQGSWGGGFSSCEHFTSKEKCWQRWDSENDTKGNVAHV